MILTIVIIITLLFDKTQSWIPFSNTHYSHNKCSFSWTTRLCSTQATIFQENFVHPPSLTVLIPAYNEEFRISETLYQYANYLSCSSQWKNRTSILVVDDGSSDQTVNVVHMLCHQINTIPIECIQMLTNQGKGAALAYGIHHILQNKHKSGLILTADADGSARIEDIETLFRTMVEMVKTDFDITSLTHENRISSSGWEQPCLVNGFRTYRDPSLLRLLFRWGFRSVVRFICGDLHVQDTQCGFKLLTYPAAQILYENLHLRGWSHDVEVLYRAKKRGIRVEESAIVWEDKDGSKLVSSPWGVVVVCAKMFGEVIYLRFNYETGRWQL